MTAIDLEAEYNNRARVPEHPGIIAGWKESAAAFRASHQNAEFGISYGPSARQMLDIFWPDASRDAPLALFIHGGYWQALDPSSFSHLATAANANGVALALCGYDLCPQVRLPKSSSRFARPHFFFGSVTDAASSRAGIPLAGI
jgi:arylformamidase